MIVFHCFYYDYFKFTFWGQAVSLSFEFRMEADGQCCCYHPASCSVHSQPTNSGKCKPFRTHPSFLPWSLSYPCSPLIGVFWVLVTFQVGSVVLVTSLLYPQDWNISFPPSPSLSHTERTSFFLVMAVPSLTKAEECGYEWGPCSSKTSSAT